MGTICTICARGGSKGVPRKNLRLLDGRPLIVHTVEQAIRSGVADRGVYVSTDDPEIARAAETAGAIVPFLRPADLATDSAGKIDVIDHLQSYLNRDGLKFDRIVDLDPTCPLRADADITGCAEMLDDQVDVVYSVCSARKNPYFNMVELDNEGFAKLVCDSNEIPVSRQAAPRVFEINGAVYAWHRQTLSLGLWRGRARVYEMPADRSFDIDTELDFRIVEFLMGQRLGAPQARSTLEAGHLE